MAGWHPTFLRLPAKVEGQSPERLMLVDTAGPDTAHNPRHLGSNVHATAPNTAGRLVRRAPEILRRWEGRVRAEVCASRGLQRPVLRNRLGFLLASVARVLSPTAEPEPFIEGLSISQDHGAHRAHTGEYSLADVFLEYRMLRETVLEVLREDGVLAADEREAINGAIERAMAEAGSQYAIVQLEAERRRGDEARSLAEDLRAAYERERRIAQVLQRPLLLKVAEDAFAGLSVATLYEPVGAEAEVGGDFLDAFALPGGKVALVVGDACGKGLEAAAHNTMVKDVLRALLREDPWHPGPVLCRLNNAVVDMLDAETPRLDDTFVVLSLVVMDPPAGEAVSAAAGAERPLLLRASGEVEVVDVGGMALGIQANQRYEEVSLHLEPGDTVLMVTDGITEARVASKLLGYEGMVQLAKRYLTAGSLYDVGGAILDRARDFAGGSLKDDACLILARIRVPGER
jgi:serine phosphatase RsbU (regulator of sigma subunit)